MSNCRQLTQEQRCQIYALMKVAKIDIKNFVLSIIIPVYNEKETISDVIDAVVATPYNKEIIIIDDH